MLVDRSLPGQLIDQLAGAFLGSLIRLKAKRWQVKSPHPCQPAES